MVKSALNAVCFVTGGDGNRNRSPLCVWFVRIRRARNRIYRHVQKMRMGRQIMNLCVLGGISAAIIGTCFIFCVLVSELLGW